MTAIWLLPFYPSPLKDDGYDIADFTGVHPNYGTLDDVVAFLDAAHARGLRVITELVINHTSDQHPWFQRARTAPKGSPERDFYVWSDDPNKYAGTRIIFTDTETSNWTWDPLAQQFFWHRFFSHQPDLNFDNPAVLEAVLDVMRFWLRLGVDGLRLDAIPYLVEREGTNCENLPETHVVLKKLRAVLDAEFPGRVFLAEANQWPSDVRPYFGDGDECHMAFHFPVMPRMYMALAREDRTPIVDIMARTPAIPSQCQWAIFLRNHDELTLEMVTDEERDYMYSAYAKDPRMRVNVGIRRRLAPLMDNGRDEIELMHALLMSLPGSPMLYYGDEIGMGDNIYLGDRNGVRTPMQWSADRNAGFSSVAERRAVLPGDRRPAVRLPDGERGGAGEHADVAAPVDPRDRAAARGGISAFGRGTFEPLAPENRRVLAFLRRWEDEVILCVNNLSRHAQYVELDLREFDGLVADGAVERPGLPDDRRAALPADAERPRLPLVPAACRPADPQRLGADRAGGRMTLPPVMELLEHTVDHASRSGWQLRRGAMLGAKAASPSACGRRARRDVVVHVADGAGGGRSPADARWRASAACGRRRVPRRRAGDRYGFRIDGGEPLPDPVSRSQPDGVHALSEVVDPTRIRLAGWQLARHWRCPTSSSTSCTSARSPPRAPSTRSIPRLGAARARSASRRSSSCRWRSFPGARNWGYDGVAPLRAAPRLRRARGPAPARERRAPARARRRARRRVQPRRARGELPRPVRSLLHRRRTARRGAAR